ncbi:hypothetical protein BGX38DRAFT_1149497, partial [Terfezia claveryi]
MHSWSIVSYIILPFGFPFLICLFRHLFSYTRHLPLHTTFAQGVDFTTCFNTTI